MQTLTVNEIAALIVVTIGLIIDWRTTKIPNWLTFPGAVCGLTLSSINDGATGAIHSIEGWIIGVTLTLIASFAPIGTSKAKLGMGDVKLLGAVGAFLGPGMILLVFFYFCLVYGLISIVFIVKAIPWEQISELSAFLIGTRSQPFMLDKQKLTEIRKKPIPIGCAIGTGTLLAILLEKPTLKLLGFG